MGKNKFKRQQGLLYMKDFLKDARKQFAAESAKNKTSPQYDQHFDKADDYVYKQI